MKKIEFRGVFPAIITPMTPEGGLNEEAFRKVVEFNIQAGVQGFWVAGGTGESVLLEDEENMRLAEIAADQSGGRAINIMHVGAATTARAAKLAEHNPVDRLAPLAKAEVPIFHIHGDVDRVVPLDENSGEVKKRYDELGGEMALEVVEGQGHNMWSGWFQSQRLVDFVIRHARKGRHAGGPRDRRIRSSLSVSGLSPATLGWHE